MSDPEQDPFTAAISRQIWESKYRFRGDPAADDGSIQGTWRRVARALAAVESEPAIWEKRFYGALADFKFLPGGRILAGAGTGKRVTLFNCFVMGPIEDSIDGIFDALKEGALTMQQGGGVGYDFSTLRPSGASAKSVGTIASGPVSFMQIWDAMCATLLSTGARRGAMMATLRCDHPDVESFIAAKRDPAKLRHFNLSVLVHDELMRAIAQDQDWALVFPIEGAPEAGDEIVERRWSGATGPVRCRVMRRVRARALWDQLMRATYDYAEPGVIFIDRINRLNNLWYEENISATNPCGEIPLPPYGACDLGSVNLTRFVRDPFTSSARIDWDGLRNTTALAVRMMDDVIDVSRFPLARQAERAKLTRRIGLGLTGLADTLILLGLHYGEQPARQLAAELMRTISESAWRASIELAQVKGAFPLYRPDKYLAGEHVSALPEQIRHALQRHGIRNSHLTAIAPTGTISLLANNVSSGLEPVYDFRYSRKVLGPDGTSSEYPLVDYALDLWQKLRPGAEPPPSFVSTQALEPGAHLAMQAALQPYVDNSISKTINVPRGHGFDDFAHIYLRAFQLGLKGCTTFRPNPITGTVLELDPGSDEGRLCCTLEREAD
jgi:ribonucleoside-diphosphate reductase alpha chain